MLRGEKMKNAILAGIGAVGSFLSYLFGGWDTAAITLVIFMTIDFISGWIVAFCHRSKKTESGGLSSKVGFIGLSKKFIILLLIIVANRFDLMLGVDYIRTGACIAFMANEALSIIENAGLMGIPIPAIITKGIDLLHQKGDTDNG